MHVLTYMYTRIDIRVYAKYERIIRVCVVRIYLSCTVNLTNIGPVHMETGDPEEVRYHTYPW